MKVFVAGATGAIGQPLIAELIAEGHTVTGMTHSEAGARRLRAAGADVAIADALNGDAVKGVLRAAHADVVIDELQRFRGRRRSFRRMPMLTRSCASRAGTICTALLLPAVCGVTSSSRADTFSKRRKRWPMRALRLL